MIFKQISKSDAIDFLLPRHYSGRKPQISYSFGVVDEKTNNLVAVCTFGMPANHYLTTGLAGEKYKNSVYELNRLCREPSYSEPLSKFVSWCLRQLKSKNIYVVSYSDMAMNHHGYIYQALNFIYTGATKERTDIYCGKRKHSRHYTEDDKNRTIRLKRFSKHRYVYICAKNKYIKREMLQNIKYPILPYPKGDNSKDYILGNYLKDTLIDKNTGEILKEAS